MKGDAAVMFKCAVCDEILEPCQCIFGTDERHCEVYVCCPCCGGECGNYEREEDEGVRTRGTGGVMKEEEEDEETGW